jgi:hypothetical protein
MNTIDLLAAGLGLAGAVLLAFWLVRLRRQLARGERTWNQHPYRMVRAVALVGMAGTLWWMLATLLTFPAVSESVRIAAPVAVAVTSAMLATAAVWILAPRRGRQRRLGGQLER